MIPADVSLDGRTALVTGSGRGVGRGIAQVLAERGAAVAVNDLHEERARAVAAELGDAGHAARAAAFDISDYEAVLAGIAEIEDELGPLDILVNNAGVPEGRHQGLFADSSPSDWAPYIDLNVYGSMYCMRTVLPGMCERGWGRVVQISSGVAARGVPYGRAAYGASKAAVEGLIRHVAIEVAQRGVTVNALSLGSMTNAVEYADPKVIEYVLERTPVGRGGDPREAGAAVAWLSSDGAGFVTGQVIHLNGGAYQGR